MKSISYLDMVAELLNKKEFLQFKNEYEKPITKSIKIVNKHGGEKYVKNYLQEEWNLDEPNFSFQGNKYNDVIFAVRKEGLKLDSLGNSPLHQAGLIYVQEMAAGLSAQVLNVKEGDIVLDMCAAPGGKSIQLADKLDKGFVISNELDSGRLKALESNIHRCGLYNVGLTHQDGCVFGDMLPEFFNKVLVDAPCSGEGMQYKNGKKIRQRDEKKCQKLSDLQTQLLVSGLKSLKVGGEIVYSTCTTNPLENEIVISNILSLYRDKLELLNVEISEKSDGISNWRGTEILSLKESKKIARFWPHIQHTGGFFIAKFKKIKSFGDTKESLFGTEKNNLDDLIWERLSEFGISKNNDLSFIKGKYTVNVALKSMIDFHLKSEFSEIEIGLPIFKILQDSRSHQEKLISLVGISKVFENCTKNTMNINDEQFRILMNKGDLRDEKLEELEGKYVILKWNGIGVGLVSVQNGIGKNKCF